MRCAPLPSAGSWVHLEARDGVEVVFPRLTPGGAVLRGHTAAVEQGEAWAVDYAVDLDPSWLTVRARVTAHHAPGSTTVVLERTGAGGWLVDGRPRPDLDGCVDVDLEASAVTNTLPVHRLDLVPGEPVSVPAAFVRADATVERLEQVYALAEVSDSGFVLDYAAPAFDVTCRLTYDAAGLVLDYPGLARRLPVTRPSADRRPEPPR